MKKLIALVLCVMMILAAMSACTANAPQTAAPAQEGGSAAAAPAAPAAEGAAVKDTIVMAFTNEPVSLTTNKHNAQVSDFVNQILYNGLFRTNENMELVPDLCESYETASDTEWIFHLKKDVYFHNGEKMSADDVVATLLWTQEFPEVEAYALSYAETIEAVDENTVRIVTKDTRATILNDLANHANYICPKALIEAGHDFNAEPIGTGPYKFVSWTPSEKLEFEANEQYFDGVPAIKHLVWKVIPEGSSRTIALQAGEVDYITNVATADYNLLMEDPNIQVDTTDGCVYNYMMTNDEKWPFDDVNFRKAVNCAIDKDAIVKVAINGLGTGLYAQTPVTLPGTVTANADSYDPDKAREYLAAWGGDLSKVNFTILCSNDTKLKVGEVIQAYLGEVGITCTLSSVDQATYLEMSGTKDYDAAIGGYGQTSLLTLVKTIYASDNINASNNCRFSDSEVDALIQKAMQTVDPVEQIKVIEALSARLNDCCPGIPLYLNTVIRAYNKNIAGVTFNGNDDQRYNSLYWLG